MPKYTERMWKVTKLGFTFIGRNAGGSRQIVEWKADRHFFIIPEI